MELGHQALFESIAKMAEEYLRLRSITIGIASG
jgi:hypothetical protein